LNLLPRDEKFFEYFHQHSGILCRAAQLLLSGMRGGYDGMCGIQKQMEALERSGDEIAHEIFRRLRSTFITPFDPEDIQTLITALDDVLDAVEDATFRIVAYRVDPIPDAAIQLGDMIGTSCSAIGRALRALHERRPVMDDCIEVNRLEDEADAVERTTLTALFSREVDPVTLIKHKDIIEVLESTTDRCEDVADVIQNVAVKNI
jgi:predicted phosphate transport protein (TIGR00153 family)